MARPCTRRIPVAGPWITEKEIRYATEAASTAWYENANLYQERFEAAFAVHTNRRFAIALPSCTAALHLSLAALGIGPGDEVIVPDITWIATSAPITYVGATPVFADIDARTWCLSPGTVSACLSPRTRAIIVVDLYGGMARMDELERLASQHSIALIEDAAEAIGSEFQGRRAGNFGAVSTFSFHGSKTLTTGEGGMLVTSDQHLYRRAQVLRDHGRQPGDRMFLNTEVAFKYKMTAFQAAIGLAQLERLEELVEQKRRIFSWYAEELAGQEGVTLNCEPPEVHNSYWMVTALLDGTRSRPKADVIRWFDEHGVDTRPFFTPLSALPAYQHSAQAIAARGRNEVAYRISPSAINLPSALTITREQVQYVCTLLLEMP